MEETTLEVQTIAIFVALLRAIGPGTHAKMSMKDLREGCEMAGLKRVTSYIATGNLILETRKSAATVEAIVERVVRGFDLNNRVVLRTRDELAAIVAANPFPEAARVHPSELAVCFLAAQPGDAGLARLRAYEGPEQFTFVGRDLCIDYPAGTLGSRLVPGAIERRLGTVGTARNWNTVRRLLELAGRRD